MEWITLFSDGDEIRSVETSAFLAEVTDTHERFIVRNRTLVCGESCSESMQAVSLTKGSNSPLRAAYWNAIKKQQKEGEADE